MSGARDQGRSLPPRLRPLAEPGVRDPNPRPRPPPAPAIPGSASAGRPARRLGPPHAGKGQRGPPRARAAPPAQQGRKTSGRPRRTRRVVVQPQRLGRRRRSPPAPGPPVPSARTSPQAADGPPRPPDRPGGPAQGQDPGGPSPGRRVAGGPAPVPRPVLGGGRPLRRRRVQARREGRRRAAAAGARETGPGRGGRAAPGARPDPAGRRLAPRGRRRGHARLGVPNPPRRPRAGGVAEAPPRPVAPRPAGRVRYLVTAAAAGPQRAVGAGRAVSRPDHPLFRRGRISRRARGPPDPTSTRSKREWSVTGTGVDILPSCQNPVTTKPAKYLQFFMAFSSLKQLGNLSSSFRAP